MSNLSTFDFNIAIFDLDLTLHDGEKLYPDTVSILSSLKSRGIKLYIASFHLDAAGCCKHYQIDEYFEEILYGRDKSKYEMISSIMDKNNTTDHQEVIFFDDNIYNVIDVKQRCNIRVVHIDILGISWVHIPFRYERLNPNTGNELVDNMAYFNSVYAVYELMNGRGGTLAGIADSITIDKYSSRINRGPDLDQITELGSDATLDATLDAKIDAVLNASNNASPTTDISVDSTASHTVPYAVSPSIPINYPVSPVFRPLPWPDIDMESVNCSVYSVDHGVYSVDNSMPDINNNFYMSLFKSDERDLAMTMN